MKGVIISEVPGLYQVIQLKPFRRTPGVEFDQFPMSFLDEVDAIDRVIHEGSAISPGPVDGVERPWYMHPNQADNLLVLSGMRHVEVYTPKHGKIESFDVTADEVLHNGKSIARGGAMLVWPRGVFHRIRRTRQRTQTAGAAAVKT